MIFNISLPICLPIGIQRADANYPHHVDVKNLHTFQAKDLEKLILKVGHIWHAGAGLGLLSFGEVGRTAFKPMQA